MKCVMIDIFNGFNYENGITISFKNIDDDEYRKRKSSTVYFNDMDFNTEYKSIEEFFNIDNFNTYFSEKIKLNKKQNELLYKILLNYRETSDTFLQNTTSIHQYIADNASLIKEWNTLYPNYIIKGSCENSIKINYSYSKGGK